MNLVERANGPVLLAFDQGLATITLNRPEAANALDVELLRVLHEVVLAVHADSRVHAVVLAGAGKNFCGGGDVKTFAAQGSGLPDYLRVATAWLSLAVGALVALEVPVVAAVQGWATGGGGLGLVCAADFVLAGERTRFRSGAVDVGMAPDAGVSVLLPHLIGLRRASEVLLAGRVLVAEEAREWGLVTAVVPDAAVGAAASAMAARFRSSSRPAIGAAKRLLWSGLGVSLADRLVEDARVVADLAAGPDAAEGLAAVIERRSPRFGAPGGPPA